MTYAHLYHSYIKVSIMGNISDMLLKFQYLTNQRNTKELNLYIP